MRKRANSNCIYDETVKECLDRIDLYAEQKENSPFDTFYYSHLNCMKDLLERSQEDIEMKYALIFAPDGHVNNNGSTSPVYLTVCKNPYWDGKEGLMLQGGMYDATKFNIMSDDVSLILDYCRYSFPDKKFCIVEVDKRLFGSLPREVWDDVKGDFDETKCIGDRCLTDSEEMDKFREHKLKEYEEKVKQKELEFHKSRRIFAILDGKVLWCNEEGLSHHEWLVDGNIVCDMVFNDLVRGFTDKDGVYFYSGDFETSAYVEDIAKSFMNEISKEKPVYCGLIKGKVGDKWKPINVVRG